MSYKENVCKMFRRKGLDDKYDYPGIYCIKVNGQIVYIGKSVNMLERIAAHYVGIKTRSECKYRILAEVQQHGYTVEFDVLYYAQKLKTKDLNEEIGSKEGELIREYRPILNTQIPKEQDWRQWEVVKLNEGLILKQLLGE